MEDELKFIRDKLKYSRDFGAFVTEILDLKFESFHNEWIETFERNKFNLLLAPRGHGKTGMLGGYVIWKIVNDANVRILVITINQDMADGMMRFIKGHLEGNNKLIRYFGEQQGNVLWAKKEFIVKSSKNRKEPTLKVVGTTGSIVGGHHDIIILDDITDKENSKTEHSRKGLQFQLDNEIMKMLEFKPYGKIISVGTRWHQDDIYNYISKKPGYNYKKYVALIYESDKLKEFVSRFTRDDWHNVNKTKQKIRDYINKLPDDKKPIVLWEWKMPYEELAMARASDGNISFMMQYQNEFVSPEDAPIKWEWIETARDNYKQIQRPYESYMGVDLASKGKESDYFTITVVAKKNNMIHITDGLRDKLSLQVQTDEIKRMFNKWSPVFKIGIEQAGPQKIVVEHIMNELTGYPIIPVKTSSVNDRPGRVANLSVLFETGAIVINPELTEWIDELASYPRGSNDDCLDSLSFAIQTFMAHDDKKPPLNWEAAADMVSSRKTVNSVDRSYDFYKI